MTTNRLRLLLSIALLLAPTNLAGDEKRPPGIFSRTITKDGIRMDVRMEPVEDPNASVYHMGDDVRLRVHVEEVAGGTPIRGANPAAWLDLSEGSGATTPGACLAKIKRHFETSAFNHADLDLTLPVILVMNDSPTIGVVYASFGDGDHRLIARIDLPSPAEDWVADAAGDHIYVTLPASHQVAAIDTARWKVSTLVNAGIAPARILLQPDGRYLWVADDSGGAIAIDASSLKVAATIRTGAGAHRMAITPNSSFLFVSNADAGTVSVIDTRKLTKLKDVAAGKSPGSLAYSPLAQALYVTSEPDGLVTVIGGADFSPMVKITVEAGISNLRFEPSGRYALALNGLADRMYVFDASTNRLVNTARTERAPNQLGFSDKLAFIRHAGSDTVLMVPFESLGKAGAISAADFTGGNHAPGEMQHLAAADGIVQYSSEDGVIVANPGDRAVYLYMEGMAAPMGNFSNFGESPRAVMVMERNLRERKPGDYETAIRLPAAGDFDMALFVDSPRIEQCIDFVVEKPAGAPEARQLPKLELLSQSTPAPGKLVEVRFRLSESAGGRPIEGLAGLVVLLVGPGAVWQSRQEAAHIGAGIYAAQFQPSDAGIYLIYAAAPAAGLDFQQYGTVRVRE